MLINFIGKRPQMAARSLPKFNQVQNREEIDNYKRRASDIQMNQKCNQIANSFNALANPLDRWQWCRSG